MFFSLFTPIKLSRSHVAKVNIYSISDDEEGCTSKDNMV